MVGAGDLDRKITVQSYTESADADGYGSLTRTWSNLCERRAKVEMETGGSDEDYAAERKTDRQRVMFTIRHDSTTKTIRPKMRVVYDSRYYDIENVHEMTGEYRRMYIRIECFEDVDNNG